MPWGPGVSTTKPKKKRIRRQKLELEYLRKLVVSLEEKMSDLKVKQSSRAADHNEKPPTSSTEGLSTWKGIAERQEKERTRVEEKNKKLRVSLKGQLKLAKQLESLLHKRPRDEETKALVDTKRAKSSVSTVVSPTDEEIFADQLAHVQRAHLDIDQVFGGPEFANQSSSFYNLIVENDTMSNTGVAFIKKAKSVLPFDIKVAEKAFWRTLAKEGTKKDSYFVEERLTGENLAASSYGLVFRTDKFHANVLGKQTYRKYVTADKVVIMWKWVVDPIDVNGSTFCGVQCHETGWIVLRSADVANTSVPEIAWALGEIPSSTDSTQLQSYAKMTIELQDDVANQELQIGALTNFVVNMHETITDVCTRMITEVLVEEDWNLNGWLGTMIS
ncbi:hypothetical protein P3T76_010521 [Phytophthora citrophthora]|uniref:M96 mating-specific protein family n=1 Tax=Phytophthora citrophthora TaxID=4793 RepID=A0AAD9LHG3_9STRA|nr:hypothetical protein P3T76_010521 [Phytophthora citrophthora]